MRALILAGKIGPAFQTAPSMFSLARMAGSAPVIVEVVGGNIYECQYVPNLRPSKRGHTPDRRRALSVVINAIARDHAPDWAGDYAANLPAYQPSL